MSTVNTDSSITSPETSPTSIAAPMKPVAKKNPVRRIAKKAGAKTPRKAAGKAPTKAISKTPAKAPTQPARSKPALKKSSEPAAKPKAKTVTEPKVIEPKFKKPKLVRDSFTFPKDEYQAIASLKQKALTLKHSAKKSEILRAGLKLLSGLNEKAFLAALTSVPALKTGRPAKS